MCFYWKLAFFNIQFFRIKLSEISELANTICTSETELYFRVIE